MISRPNFYLTSLIGIGDIISGNHNDLYDIIGQFSKIMNQIKKCGICVENSYLNADKGFDCKELRRAIHRRKMFPNIEVKSVF